MNRRSFLSNTIAAAFVSSIFSSALAEAPAVGRQKVSSAIEKGLDFLKSRQHPKGYWSTSDYPGLTGLVVQAFALAPGGKAQHSDVIRKGLDFIRESVKADGGIYNKGMGNYNTAIALTTLLRAGEEKDRKLIDAARDYLIGAQTKGGVQPANDGGFGYEPGNGRGSRPDLDNTVFVLEALATYKEANRTVEMPGQKDLNWQAAIDFVSRCQNLQATNKEKWASDAPNEKGGFTYTPGGDDKGTHSYGTMTYAGLLSLIHADVKKDDPRVKAAVDWLSRHYSLEENPGQGLNGLYYYYFVMAKGLTAAGLDQLPTKNGGNVDWRNELAAKLLALQKPDGSWANEAGRWMEKDPVLVTSYVVLALDTISGKLK